MALTPEQEAQRRRTFAIIAHPDAGKTTLTENLLLAGGAIRMAGAVKARGERRRTVGLDEDRARARHLGLGLGDDVRIRTACSTCSTRRATRTSRKTPIAR
jgi:hypothetical protein